jgi:hypothetical protein
MNTSTFFEHHKGFCKLRTTFLKIMKIFSQRGHLKIQRKVEKRKKKGKEAEHL